MKTITIRDLRQRWPETEAALQVEDEIVITRDGQPVAKLTRLAPEKPRRKRWDPEAHKRWLKKVWGTRRCGCRTSICKRIAKTVSFHPPNDLSGYQRVAEVGLERTREHSGSGRH